MWVLPLTTNAQFTQSLFNEQFAISVSPQYPNPGDTVTATVNDYSLGATGGSIAWFIDGKAATSSVNARSITFIAGAPLTPTTVRADLRLGTGEVLTASQTIVPRYLDIIVEPQTYVPQWYSGRALPTNGSLVRLTALLHGQNGPVDHTAYTYTWKVNNNVIGGGGVRGGYQTTYTVPIGQSHLVSLEITDTTGRMVSKKNITVGTGEVDAVLYEANQLYGLGHRAIGNNRVMTGNSLTIEAVPYNLDLRALYGNIFTEWKINNQKVTEVGKSPFTITLGRQGFGAVTLGFKVRNPDALLQGDEVSTVLQF